MPKSKLQNQAVLKPRTKIIIATTASINLIIFSVLVLTKSLEGYKLDEWFYLMGIIGIVGILLAARSESRQPKSE